MSRFIFYAILVYLLYRFIADFLIPVGKASAQVRKNVQRMQQQQFEQQRQQQQYQRQQQQAAPKSPQTEKDYIEFEEIK